jgi:flagellar hook-basal body protein
MKNIFMCRRPVILLTFAAITSLAWMGCDNPVSEPQESIPGQLDVEVGSDAANGYPFQQGELQYTGNPLDVAIVGKGMLILKNENRFVYFRRPARLVLNAEGHVTFGNEAFHLQGMPLWNPDKPDSVLPIPKAEWKPLGTAGLVDIRLPFRQMMPARATTELGVSLNLSPDCMGRGSILYSQRYLQSAPLNSSLVALSDSRGTELGMRPGDVLTFSKQVGNTFASAMFKVTERSTLQGIVDALADFLKSEGAQVVLIRGDEDADLRGAITLFGNTSAIENLQVTSTRPISSPKITKAFAVPSLIPAGSVRMEVTTDGFRAPATPENFLIDLFDTHGNPLGLEPGDEISVAGTSGGTPDNNVSPFLVTSTTTFQAVLDAIQRNFRLPDRDGTPANQPSVSLNGPATDDNIPDGAIVLRGMPGSAYTLGSVVISANNGNNGGVSPNNFNANMNMTTLRPAKDVEVVETVATVYDALGMPHEWFLTFTPTQRPLEWLWEIRGAEGEAKWSGNSGILVFGDDRSLQTWNALDSDPFVRCVPKTGGQALSVRLQFGKTATQTGLTGLLTSDAEPQIVQNGYAAGYRIDTRIDELGRIRGIFSNGQERDLYQIPLADFPNEFGLTRVGANSFMESNASGSPYVGTGLGRDIGRFSTGYLEQAPVTTAQKQP